MSESKFGHRFTRMRNQMKRGGAETHYNALNPFKLATLLDMKFSQSDSITQDKK